MKNSSFNGCILLISYLFSRLQLPDVMDPGNIRNELYITLSNEGITKQKKMCESNLSIYIKILDSIGIEFSNKISQLGYENWKHTDQIFLEETVRVRMQEFELCKAHIRFEFVDETTGLFWICWMPTTNEDGTIKQDGNYNLCVWRWLGTRCPLPTDYFTDQNKKMLKCTKHILSIHFQLCSTKLTQNIYIIKKYTLYRTGKIH